VIEKGLPLVVKLVPQVATPALTSTEVQIAVAPLLKVTVPVGVPLPAPPAVRVAVKVAVWPDTEGLALLANAVTELALFTTSETAALVEVLKLLSPE
jgi:hypothetical protein